MAKLIVELCQNHNGDRDIFERQIASAAENGADYIKMQSMWSDDLTERSRFEDGELYDDGSQKTIKRPYGPEKERLAKLDLTLDDHLFFIEMCKKHGVTPMTTIFAAHRVADVGSLPWPKRVVKVASYDCASLPFLRELANHFDEFIISTGATYDDEIRETARLMDELGKTYSFLHCVTSYPNTVEVGNLSRMDWLRQFTPSVGWSDHSHVEKHGIDMAKVAIMLGADLVERHYTVLGAADTKDGPVSITPELLKELSEFRNLDRDIQQEIVERDIPDWRIMLGLPQRDMSPTELLNRDYYRGRFASPHPSGAGWRYNWEERPMVDGVIAPAVS